jgi:predicted transglutaminase-like cysteine proteinase
MNTGWLSRKQRSLLLGCLFAFAIPILANSTFEVISQAEIENAAQKYGTHVIPKLNAWQKLVDDSKALPEQEKLVVVNNFFNQNVVFLDDIIHWKQKDYWASPIEFLATGAGDCEDYSIAKYFTLIALGVEESKLLITYVKALRLGQAHMVLTYYKTPTSIPVVLDNLNPKILPATERTDLAPVYSFNGGGIWLSKLRGKGMSVPGGLTRLNSWNELQKRLDSFK